MPDILQSTACVRVHALAVPNNTYRELIDPDTDLQFVVPVGHVLILSGIYWSWQGWYFLRINWSIELTEDESRSERMFKWLVLVAWDTLEVKYWNTKNKEDIVLCWELFLKAS